MSANTSKLPLNIECFMNDIDVSSGMQRGDMEDMCAHLFKRIEETMKRCLKDSSESQQFMIPIFTLIFNIFLHNFFL
jgi:heat shock protein 110kDa